MDSVLLHQYQPVVVVVLAVEVVVLVEDEVVVDVRLLSFHSRLSFLKALYNLRRHSRINSASSRSLVAKVVVLVVIGV